MADTWSRESSELQVATSKNYYTANHQNDQRVDEIIVWLLAGSANIDEKMYIPTISHSYYKIVLKSKYVDKTVSNSKTINQRQKRESRPFIFFYFVSSLFSFSSYQNKYKWWRSDGGERSTNIIWNNRGAKNTAVWVVRRAIAIICFLHWTLSVF